MKRILTLILAAALILAVFAGCTPASADVPDTSAVPGAETTDTPGGSGGELKTLVPGTLKVGMEIGYPPMEYLAEDGTTPIGFDVDVAAELAARLGLTVELVDTAWDAIFISLDSDRYDIIISSVSINESRQEKYNLTRPYIANKLVLITRPDSAVVSPDELAGLQVAVQTDTTASEHMDALQADGLTLGGYYVYDKVIQCFDELKLGRVDAVLVDSVVAAYYLYGDADSFRTAWENDEAEPMALCMKKGNDQLLEAVEAVIDEMYADGTIAEIAAKNFGDEYSTIVLQGTR